MIIILADGKGFNNSWDKQGLAKNWTILLRVQFSQLISNETGQRLSDHLEMGSSRTVIHTVMLTQFWAHIWAQIPHCTFCVDLYLIFTLGGSQPCSGSSAAAVNEASSESCPMCCPDERYLEEAMASQSSPRPWANQPNIVPSGSVGLGAALPPSHWSGSSSEGSWCLGLSHRDGSCSPVMTNIFCLYGQHSRQGTEGWVY